MHANLILNLHHQKGSEDASTIQKNLVEHNNRFRTSPGIGQELTVTFKDSNGALVAGLNGQLDWGWLFVKMLWVQEDFQSQKLGSRLLHAAEEEAVLRGCTKAWLDTFNPLAKPFYEKRGYEVFGQLPDFPPGKTRYFFRKNLTP